MTVQDAIESLNECAWATIVVHGGRDVDIWRMGPLMGTDLLACLMNSIVVEGDQILGLKASIMPGPLDGGIVKTIEIHASLPAPDEKD